MRPKNNIYEKFRKIDPKKINKFKNKYAKHKMFSGVSVVLGRDKERKYIILVCNEIPYYERWTHDQITYHLHLQRLSINTLVVRKKSLFQKQKLVPMRGSLSPYLVELVFFERPPKQKKRQKLKPPAIL